MTTFRSSRLRLFLAVLVTSAVLAVSAPSTVAAAPAGGLAVPASGGGSGLTFTGTMLIQKFVATDGVVYAVGTLTGTATTAGGLVTSFIKNVKIPVIIGPTSCDILHLELGPIALDLLGLQVNLNKIVLDIDAQSGPGNLLGNLLCAIAGLLDNPTGLARVLNDILNLLS